MYFRIFILPLLSNLRSRQYSAVSKVSHRNSTPALSVLRMPATNAATRWCPLQLPSLSLARCLSSVFCTCNTLSESLEYETNERAEREGQAARTVSLSFLPPIPCSRLLVSLMRPRRKGNKTLRISYGCLAGFSHRAHISGLQTELGSYYGMKLSNGTATRLPRYRPY